MEEGNDQQATASEGPDAGGQGCPPVSDVQEDHVGDHGIEGLADLAQSGQVPLVIADAEWPSGFQPLGVVEQTTGGVYSGYLGTAGGQEPAQVALAAAGIEYPCARRLPEEAEDRRVQEEPAPGVTFGVPGGHGFL